MESHKERKMRDIIENSELTRDDLVDLTEDEITEIARTDLYWCDDEDDVEKAVRRAYFSTWEQVLKDRD